MDYGFHAVAFQTVKLNAKLIIKGTLLPPVP
jgi:hypothetical protein